MPWSVPLEAFSFSRRPNSENSRTTTRSSSRLVFRLFEKPGHALRDLAQQVLVGVALAGVGVEPVLGRVVDPQRQVGLDQAADRLQPACERLGRRGGALARPAGIAASRADRSRAVANCRRISSSKGSAGSIGLGQIGAVCAPGASR